MTSIDDMADEIMKGMEEYLNLSQAVVKAAVRKTATSVKKEIQSNAPVKTGAYKKSWTMKKTAEDSHQFQITVYSKNHYWLTHLLERGHALRNGGRARAFPHIAPAEQNGVEMLKSELEKNL